MINRLKALDSLWQREITPTQATLGFLGVAAAVGIVWLLFGLEAAAWAIAGPALVGLVLLAVGGGILLVGLAAFSVIALLKKLAEVFRSRDAGHIED